MHSGVLLLRPVLSALAVVALAALLRFWAVPLLERLPGDYLSEVHYDASMRMRQTPASSWIQTPCTVWRRDQALSNTEDTSLIQGEEVWEDLTGRPTYQSSGLYGVDRRTRENVPAYGNTSRYGQYLFPPHFQRTAGRLWDASYTVPRTLVFEREALVEGLRVYVFGYQVEEADDSAGYSFLPDVPERYLASAQGRGTLWIEPVSGTVVDHSDEGTAWFVERETGKKLAELDSWRSRFTDETRAERLQQARAERTRIWLLEDGVPGGFVLGALAWLILGWRSETRAGGSR